MTTGVSSVTGISPFTFLNTTRPWFFFFVGRYAPVISAIGVWKMYLRGQSVLGVAWVL